MSWCRFRNEGKTLTVQFTCDRILEDIVGKVGKRLIRLAERQAPTRLILDFRNVRFMSSAMIGKLVLLNKHTAVHRIDLRFCNVQANIMEVFRITQLHRVFKFGADDLRRVVRFVPELFEARNRVLVSLADTGYYWLSDFTSVEPLHDVYGIEVRGIKDPGTAGGIQQVLLRLFPDWRSPL